MTGFVHLRHTSRIDPTCTFTTTMPDCFPLGRRFDTAGWLIEVVKYEPKEGESVTHFRPANVTHFPHHQHQETPMPHKLLTLNIRTTYPNGYSRKAGRGIEGTVEFQPDGASDWSYDTHELSPECLQAIADAVMYDITRHYQPQVLPTSTTVGIIEFGQPAPAPETGPGTGAWTEPNAPKAQPELDDDVPF